MRRQSENNLQLEGIKSQQARSASRGLAPETENRVSTSFLHCFLVSYYGSHKLSNFFMKFYFRFPKTRFPMKRKRLS